MGAASRAPDSEHLRRGEAGGGGGVGGGNLHSRHAAAAAWTTPGGHLPSDAPKHLKDTARTFQERCSHSSVVFNQANVPALKDTIAVIYYHSDLPTSARSAPPGCLIKHTLHLPSGVGTASKNQL